MSLIGHSCPISNYTVELYFALLSQRRFETICLVGSPHWNGRQAWRREWEKRGRKKERSEWLPFLFRSCLLYFSLLSSAFHSSFLFHFRRRQHHFFQNGERERDGRERRGTVWQSVFLKAAKRPLDLLFSFFRPHSSCSASVLFYWLPCISTIILFIKKNHVVSYTVCYLGPVHTGEVFQWISVQLHFKNQFLTHN